jgi:hypothetical protein
MRTKVISKFVAALGVTVACAWSSAPTHAYEAGWIGTQQKPGLALGGATAGTPPPGIYMFEQFATYQATIVGPHVLSGPKVELAGAASGLVFVPGWTFLGATYDAVIVAPFLKENASAPINLQAAGMHNTYIVPAELSWKLGDSGFFVKAGLGIYVPDGTLFGANGLSNLGNPWWTFQPELIVSYLKDGWNFTANVFAGFQTKNTITGYQTGNMLQAEFTATKTIGKWAFGPVGYYSGQISNDTSSAFYHGAINLNRYDRVAVGALISYNFGPASLSVWAVDEFYATASGKTPLVAGSDAASVPEGYSVFAQLSYKIWSFDDPPAPTKRPQFNK